MGNQTFSNARYWEGTEAASNKLATKALTDSIDPYLVPTFATTAERDAKTATLRAAGNQGLTCYVTARKGKCYWDGTEWQWQSIHKALADGRREAAADSAGGVPINIILFPAITLPGTGNRRLMINASSSAVGLAVPGQMPGLLVEGPGISGEEGVAQAISPQVGYTTGLHRTWYVIASGTVAYNLRGADVHPTAPSSVRFRASIFQIFDLGPTD